MLCSICILHADSRGARGLFIALLLFSLCCAARFILFLRRVCFLFAFCILYFCILPIARGAMQMHRGINIPMSRHSLEHNVWLSDECSFVAICICGDDVWRACELGCPSSQAGRVQSDLLRRTFGTNKKILFGLDCVRSLPDYGL